MRQLNLDTKPLTGTSLTAPRCAPAFMRRVTVVAAVCFAWCLMVALASAQNVEHNSKSADLALRSDLKVNPSTHGLELQIPLASYSGRAGFGLPVSLSYSSKLWRFKYAYFNLQTQLTGVSALYAEHSAAGWTSNIGVPVIDTEPQKETYTSGGSATSGCEYGGVNPENPNSCYMVDRLLVRMPGGSTHELRSGDEPYNLLSNPSPALPDELHAVDGSHLRYKRSTKELFLPDGSRYILTSTTSVQYIDRHGNKLTYANGQWTDTLGRTIPTPPLSSAVGDHAYSLPGVGGVPVTYTFKWRNLGDPGVLSPAQQVSYITNQNCSNIQTYSPFLFSGGEGCIANNYSFNPVVLYQIEFPNGQAYTYNYNAYGEIDKVTYPTGGYERYVYGPVDTPSWVGSPYSNGNRGVVSRFVSASGSGADEVAWQYGSGSGGSMRFDQFLLSQTAPDGTRTERLMYRESNSSNFGYGYNGALAGRPYEERVYSAAGVMLRRTLTEWAVTGSNAFNQYAQYATRDARVVKEVEIQLDTGGSALAATTTYQYDADLNVTATNRYGYVTVDQETAQSGAITAFTPGTLLRTDETTYLVNDTAIDATTRAAYRARQLLSLPTSTRVKDGAGTIGAKTATSYDETAYPLLTYASVPNWTNPLTNVRGLVTTASAWVNTTDTWVSTHTQYDQCGSPRNTWDANGNQSQVTYSSTYKYAYPTQTMSPDPDGGGPVTPLTTSTVYDLISGNATSQTDSNGRVTTTEYATTDALGNPNPLQRITKVNQPVGGWTAYGYSDQPGDLFVLTRTALDASRSREARKYFDALGRAWRSVLIEGATSVYTDTQYDSMGRVWKISNPYRTGQTAVWTTTTYDALGRVLTVKTPDNAQVTTSYSGNQALAKDQAGKERLTQTDALGRLNEVWEITPADDATEAVTFPGHTEVVAGYRSVYSYDTLGNLTKVTQRIGTSGTTQTRAFVYDSLSRLTSATNPESGTIQYKYDANGNLVLKIAPRSGGTSLPDCRVPYSGTKIAICYEYDALNRVTLRDYNDATPDVTQTYDTLTNGKGKPTSVSSSASTTSYAGYDVMGRVTGSSQTTDGQTYSMSYTYDLAGNLVAQTYPSGRVVTSTFDDSGRLSQVDGQKAGEDDKTYASSFSYTAHGAVSDVKLGNNLWEHTNFNNRLQPIQIGLGTVKDGVNRLKLNYTYGTTTTANNGNVKTQTITTPTVGTAAGYTATQSYRYDELNRLVEAKEVNGTSESWKQSFTFDRYGNRNFDAANTTSGLVSSNYAVDPANNRYKVQQGLIRYDDAGNLDKDYDGHSFTFDAENRQTKYDGGASVAGGASYSYDGDGRRVKKVTGGITVKTTVFVYNAMGQLVAEYDTSAQQGAGGTRYLTGDNLGTPRIITGSDGTVKARHDYMPFGEEIGLLGGRTEQQGYVTDAVRQKFTKYERDNETGLDYAKARYYANVQGRFTSADPLLSSGKPLQPQSWNRYIYCLNNPLILVDPSGLIWVFQNRGDDKIAWRWIKGKNAPSGWHKWEGPSKFNTVGGETVTLFNNGQARVEPGPVKMGVTPASQARANVLLGLADNMVPFGNRIRTWAGFGGLADENSNEYRGMAWAGTIMSFGGIRSSGSSAAKASDLADEAADLVYHGTTASETVTKIGLDEAANLAAAGGDDFANFGFSVTTRLEDARGYAVGRGLLRSEEPVVLAAPRSQLEGLLHSKVWGKSLEPNELRILPQDFSKVGPDVFKRIE